MIPVPRTPMPDARIFGGIAVPDPLPTPPDQPAYSEQARGAYIALGSNLEDPADHVRQAFDELHAHPGIRVLVRSSLYRTAPMGDPDQPDYINAACHVATHLAPLQLLAALNSIERRHGRIRTRQNAPRTLDLDIILYADYAFSVPGLTLPHSRAHTRAFVLAPLVEIAPDVYLPGRGFGKDLLGQCGEQRIERVETE